MPWRLIPLLCCAFLLSGCMWLRLLDLKNQLQEFDRYVEVQPGDGVELKFKEPVLRAADLDTLLNGQPTVALAIPDDGEVRVYGFIHLDSPLGPDPVGSESVLTILVVIRHGVVESVTLPKEVFRVVPRDLALRALRAFGHANVDTANRRAEVRVEAVAGSIPDRSAILGLFGQANRLDPQDGGGERLVWRYVLQGGRGPDAPTDAVQPKAAIAFIFAAGSQIPRQFQANVGGVWVHLDLAVTPK